MKVTQRMIENRVSLRILQQKLASKVLLDTKSYKEFNDSFVPATVSVSKEGLEVDGAKVHKITTLYTKDCSVEILEVKTNDYLFEVV